MKKKKVIIICVIVAVVLAIAGAVCFWLFSKNLTVKHFQEAVETSWSEASDKSQQPKFLALLESKSSFEIKKYHDDGDGHYTLTAEVTSPDLLPLMQELKKKVKKPLSDEMLNETFEKTIEKTQAKTSEVTLSAIRTEDGSISVEFSEAFIDAMYGYAYAFANKELVGAMNSQ